MVHPPFALLVAGTWNGTFDGRFLLRRGDPVVGDACFIDDGVFWEHEFDESLIIEGVRGSAWYMRDTRRVEWSYRHDDVVTCDPSAGGPWSAHPNENPVAEGGPAAEDSSEPTVVSALADCYSRPKAFYDVTYYESFHKIQGTEYSLCNSVSLYTRKEIVPQDNLYEFIPGFCQNVSNEISAAACLDRWCSQGADGVPQGQRACSKGGSDALDDDASVFASEPPTRVFGGFASIIGFGLLALTPLIVFINFCCNPWCRNPSSASRKDRIQPKEFLDESGMPRLPASPAARPDPPTRPTPRPAHVGGFPIP